MPKLARSLFDRQENAVLCTAHAGLGGWPFGSITPYAVLPSGDAVLFLSDIAEHTRNLARDPRASLFVADPEAREKPQAGARLAILTRARRANPDERDATEACYFARFPQAQAMRSAHGFHTYVAEVDCVRWIAGFGEMGWLSRAQWSGTADPLAAHAAGIVAHLNDDHRDAVAELVRAVCGLAVSDAVVRDLDRGGLMVAVTGPHGGTTARVPFTTVATTPDEVRQVVVAMLRALRKGG